MPFTVITVKNVPPSLKGDLTKWMQEIATGVYIGNFNRRVREKLWLRIQESINTGEATLSFSSRNEIGYLFETIHAQREVFDCDGIPLVVFPEKKKEGSTPEGEPTSGFSNAAKFHKSKIFSGSKKKSCGRTFVVLDIETDGLKPGINSIIEVGALKVTGTEREEFQAFVTYDGMLPTVIQELTGITEDNLCNEGESIDIVLTKLLEFLGNSDIIGYNIEFDIGFINKELSKINKPSLKNKRYDVMKFVKKEKLFLENYKLQTVLKAYGMSSIVPHRALLDAAIIYELSKKVNKFKEGVLEK